ncbi:TIGR03986 family CRISPR-associated RAMP protein [Alkalimarinus sediminis]|uniref:TIGR03986 family CRISPR-associated RAMP protein n=1 Tax=Alkalimarinus sediminis TaxID=1632866 RepID=A0A9E8HU61_9ALTE|nr:TIGR03986 family CRISPR-associated RAMP protein [Alkalimarinus sediminis]UZW76586.1 TIGR03986 family CRISPR-associated RAMP protein [Alkalimarinus sediminis]
MSKVYTPYHFAPLSKWVYMPDWAHLVSQDVPFEDGYSGMIEYNLTNMTALCVGDRKDKNNVLRIARNPLGTPVIPGSSLKGMLRNVLDICSFGKFNQIDDKQLSYRDISAQSDYLNKIIKNNPPIAGWIKYDVKKQVWTFTKCKFAKVHHDVIKSDLKIAISNEDKAIERYAKLPLTSNYKATISEPRGKQKNCWAENLGKGDIEGQFVFTNKRIKGQGDANFYNFSYFFYGKQSEISSDTIQQEVDNLFSNHRSVTAKVGGVEYDQVDYIQKHSHPEHGIPVFALMMRGKVHSFGFANMPRVSYKHSTQSLLDNLSKEHSEPSYFSLSELIFGALRDEGYGLKSRVNFSDAVLQTKERSVTSGPVVLSGPKSSFLGAYIEQTEPENYKSYDHDDAELSGWKRYPVKPMFEENELSNDNQAVQSKLEMLSPSHEFKGHISFHNLKKEELASLVWVLTLNDSLGHYHSLGHGKPLGAGAVQISIETNNSLIISNDGRQTEFDVAKQVEAFVAHMDAQVTPKGKWLQTPQLQYLLAMCSDNVSFDNDFKYLPLTSFKEIKNKKSAIDLIEYGGELLSRSKHSPERRGSMSFAKGRLAGLFDKDSNYHKDLQQMAEEKAILAERDLEKAKQEEEKAALEDASPFDKNLGLLTLLVADQDSLSKTEKKNKANELRSITKELKELTLSPDELAQLVAQVSQITIAEKDTQKLLKWLNNQ